MTRFPHIRTDGSGYPAIAPNDWEATTRIVDLVDATVGWPVRSLSWYYVLYQLSELDGVPQATPEWNYHRDRLRQGFFWFGIYTIAREATHAWDNYFIDDTPLREYAADPERFRELREHFRPLAPTRWRDLIFFLDDVNYLGVHFSPGDPIDTDRLLEFMWEGEQVFSMLSDPGHTIEMCRLAFQLPKMTRFDRNGWEGGFDGPPWHAVAEHLHRYTSYPPTTWVDQSFALEHNAGNWMNKIDPHPTDWQRASQVAYDDDRPKYRVDIHNDIIPRLLDAGRTGETRMHYQYALASNADFRLNLRRYDDHFELGGVDQNLTMLAKLAPRVGEPVFETGTHGNRGVWLLPEETDVLLGALVGLTRVYGDEIVRGSLRDIYPPLEYDVQADHYNMVYELVDRLAEFRDEHAGDVGSNEFTANERGLRTLLAAAVFFAEATTRRDSSPRVDEFLTHAHLRPTDAEAMTLELIADKLAGNIDTGVVSYREQFNG